MAVARHFAALFIALCIGAPSDRDAAPEPVSENESFIKIITILPEENRGFFLLDVPNPGPADSIGRYFDPARHHFLINGGYFNADFSPTGYCKIGGKVLRKGISPTLSGFVAMDRTGRIEILTARDRPTRFPTVLQNGPFVIDPGGRMGIFARSGKEAARTLIGRTFDDEILVLISNAMDLYDVALEAKRAFPELERLLNLDGGPSTAVKTRDFELRNASPVRNFLGRMLASESRRNSPKAADENAPKNLDF